MPALSLGADFLAYYFFGLKILLAVVAAFIFLSSLDDFFIDAAFLVRSAYRRWWVMPRHRRMTLGDLDRPEQRIAILVPAWHEAAVIGRMLRHLVATLDYRHYAVFVGVYPNDPGTREVVESVAQDSGRIHIVPVPHAGPTSKGDCLNAVLAGVTRRESETGESYPIIVLHDAEDIAHPLALKLFNKLIPRKDMVQLPVLPLEAPLTGLTAGHYMDEFAEHHTKDLAVREAFTGAVPSAGVGCGFSRRAFARLAAMQGGRVFNTETLTEDYQIAMHLRAMGYRLIFVRFFVDRVETRRDRRGREKIAPVRELVGTREYFPARFRGAYRQKARWLVGIAFQAWREFGWRGPLMAKYAFFRDRKGVLTAQLNILAYLVAVSVVAYFLAIRLFPDSYRYPPLVEQGSWLFYLLMANALFLFSRLAQRVVFAGRIYGWAHAAVSPARLLWGNVINFFASTRAIWLGTRALVTDRPLAWEKTVHHFPSPAELAPYHRRLGELLVAHRFAAAAAVSRALETQRQSHRPLGEILIAEGAVTEAAVLSVVAAQNGLPFMPKIETEGPAGADSIPPALQARLRAVPIAALDGTVTMASPRLLSRKSLNRLREAAGCAVTQVLCPAAEVDRHLPASEPSAG